MGDPSTYWLTVTNIALGLVVLACCAAVAFGVLQELAARHRKRVSESQELAGILGFGDGHAFNIPGLGVTMADGGEELRKKAKR